MKKIYFSLLLLLTTFTSFSQNSIFELMERTDISLQDAVNIAQRHFDTVGTGRGSGHKQFQRWLYERKFHIDENGYYISPATDWNNYQDRQGTSAGNIIQAGNWTELGPLTWNRTSSWNPGTGRIAAFAVHASNESIIYVGSPGGGLWKTINGGTTWQPLTDNNALWMSIFSLTIDPTNQNIVYAGTSGSNGLLKSTNAGATWALTGTGPTGTIRKILIHASAPNIVFACASNGIFRSTNGGTNWTQVHTGSKEDIEFKPNDLNIMYATGNDVFRSVDNGITWTSVGAAQGITNTGRTLVAVSPANPNYVYVVQASGSLFGRMYKSTDAGLTFITTVVGNPASGTNYFGYETNGTGTTGQATYDMALDISPTNAAEVYIAGIICWKSVNEATSFTAITAWSFPNSFGYNHADVHGLFWVNSTIYSISDGGLFKSINNGDDWTDISAGIGIRQFYRIANSQTNANVITGGAQDNGSVARQASGTWVDWLGADGMEGLVSPTNHLNLWGTSQYGSLYRSVNGGNSYTNLSRPNAGNWVTPLAIHPTNETILYGGWTGVWKSVNSGSSWTNIASGTITALVTDLAIAPSAPTTIYASRGTTLYVTTNDGTTWATRSAPSTINDIAVDPTNPSRIWIACNSTSNRILVSTDGGATFTNISSDLPSIVARTVVVDDNTPRGIYVGMNIGVFYQQEGASGWTNFSDNLPLVAINELDIQKAAGKIRVATYGRGVWESPVSVPVGFTFSNPAPATTTCPAPATLNINLGTNVSGGFANPITLSATAGVPPGTNITFGTNPVTPGSSSVVSLNNANTLAAGSYIITITGTASGAPTQNVNLTYTISGGAGPAITTQPADQAVCVGLNTSFSVSSASAVSYQWQVSTDGGTTYANLSNGGVYSGVNLTTLTITGATAVMNSYRYRCIPSTVCGSTTSNAAILTVNNSPVITTQPTAINTGCIGGNVSYTVAANGGALTYQWQISTTGAGGPWTNISNGAVYSGTTTATLTVTGITAIMDGYLYRSVISGTCTPAATSNNGGLTVNAPVSITTQPTNNSICATGTTSFSVAATGITPTYQWQVSNNGGAAWTNITNGGIYSGATITTLTLTGVTAGMNGYLYRAVVAGNAPCGAVNSTNATLTVIPQPTVILTASPVTKLLPGRTTTITATVNPPTGFTTVWIRNGSPVSVSGNSKVVGLNELGTYTVVATIDSCVSLLASITISDSASNKLFVFPSPNDGIFTVSYYSPGASSTSKTKQSITIYDSYGRRVHNKEYEVTQPYQLHQIDMRHNGAGVYYIVLREANGNKIKTGEVLVR
jgi:hypothetical protein